MDRRSVLRRTGVAAALALAGCSGGDGTDGDSSKNAEALDVSGLDYRAADDDHLVALITVTNTGSEPATGTLYVDVTVNDSANTRVRTVELEPAGTTEVAVEFEDVSVEQFENGSATLSTRWGYQGE